MEKRLIILSIILLFHLSGISQGKKSQLEYDQETYQLYLEQEWKDLKLLGQEALQSGYDFYYLRMRMGLASYSLGNYDSAREHFIQANSFQPHDPNADYYLYYSNLFSGRPGEARSLLDKMAQNTIESIGAPGKYSLTGVTAEYGVFQNNSIDELKATLPQGNFVSSYFMQSMNYMGLSLGMNIGYSSHLLVAVNRYQFDNIQLIQMTGEPTEFTHSNNQQGIYLKYAYQFPGSWYGGVAYHGTGGNYDVQYYIDNGLGEYEFQLNQEQYKQSFFGAYLGKRIKRFDISLVFSENQFWQGSYYQLGGNLIYYPLGNLNYYLNLGYHKLIPAEGQENKDTVIKILGGAKIIKGVYLEGSFISGNMANWADLGGYYLFNTKYAISSRTGLSVVVSGLIPHIQFSLSGFLQNRNHWADIYDIDGNTVSVQQKYSTSSFFGGLTWLF